MHMNVMKQSYVQVDFLAVRSSKREELKKDINM